MSSCKFEFEDNEANGVFVINVSGRVDGVSAEEFHAELGQSIKTHEEGGVILDFETLSYINSAGLRAILFIAKELHSKGRKFALCSLSEAIYSMIKTTGFDRVIDIYGSRSEAISAVTN